MKIIDINVVCNHLAEKETVGKFNLIVFLLSYGCLCFVSRPRFTVVYSSLSVIVIVSWTSTVENNSVYMRSILASTIQVQDTITIIDQSSLI